MRDLAQSTNFQNILHGTGNDSDESGSGELLFSPHQQYLLNIL